MSLDHREQNIRTPYLCAPRYLQLTISNDNQNATSISHETSRSLPVHNSIIRKGKAAMHIHLDRSQEHHQAIQPLQRQKHQRSSKEDSHYGVELPNGMYIVWLTSQPTLYYPSFYFMYDKLRHQPRTSRAPTSLSSPWNNFITDAIRFSAADTRQHEKQVDSLVHRLWHGQQATTWLKTVQHQIQVSGTGRSEMPPFWYPRAWWR